VSGLHWIIPKGTGDRIQISLNNRILDCHDQSQFRRPFASFVLLVNLTEKTDVDRTPQRLTLQFASNSVVREQ
jgi:hypothetical protein